MSDWIGLAVVLGAVAVTILVTVPWTCRRCQCEEEGRQGAETYRRAWNAERQTHRSDD